jgi:ketosteroid isomerase-like protein
LDDNCEIARRALEAIARKPEPDFDTINELMAPDHDFVDALAESSRGGRGFQAWLRVFNDAWETWEIQPRELLVIDEERVLQCYRFVATGHGSELAVDAEMANVMTIRDGRVVRTQAFASVEEARAALAS